MGRLTSQTGRAGLHDSLLGLHPDVLAVRGGARGGTRRHTRRCFGPGHITGLLGSAGHLQLAANANLPTMNKCSQLLV